MTTQAFKSNDLVIVDLKGDSEIYSGRVLRPQDGGYLVLPRCDYPHGDDATVIAEEHLMMLTPAAENTFQPFTREDWFGYAGAEGEAYILSVTNKPTLKVFQKAMAEWLNRPLEGVNVDIILDENGLNVNACDADGNVMYAFLTESRKIGELMRGGLETMIQNGELSSIEDFGVKFYLN